MIGRREFLISSALLARLPMPLLARRAKYDLVVKGGRLLDVNQKIDRVMDVAVSNGTIAALQANIPSSDAAEVLDAKGMLVIPGLVDIHAHPRPGELPPERVLADGVTTV